MHSIAISIKGLSMKIILFLVTMLVITSCQPPQPVVTGGSRADGLVVAKWTDVGLNLYQPDFSLTDAMQIFDVKLGATLKLCLLPDMNRFVLKVTRMVATFGKIPKLINVLVVQANPKFKKWLNLVLT